MSKRREGKSAEGSRPKKQQVKIPDAEVCSAYLRKGESWSWE